MWPASAESAGSLRQLAAQAADAGLLSSEAASCIRQLPGARKLGTRAGNWLSKEQASQLLHAPDTNTLQAKRDRALLALLLGCGLRRTELANLIFEQIQQRESRWVLLDLIGKEAESERCRCRSGSSARLMSGLQLLEYRKGTYFGPSIKKEQCGGRALPPR